MVLGYLLVNYTSLADRKLTKQANAIVFKIFLPCMLFYDGIQGCGSVVRPAGIPDSGCGIQLYHGTTGRSGWTACRTAGGVLIGAFDLYVVCDDIDIADDRIAWDLIY